MPVQEIVVSTNYITLVVNNQGGVFTTVTAVNAPTTGVVNQAAEQTLLVGTPGAQGAIGPQGPAGTGSGNTFVQDTQPVGVVGEYLWVQTHMGNSGQDITFWVFET